MKITNARLTYWNLFGGCETVNLIKKFPKNQCFTIVYNKKPQRSATPLDFHSNDLEKSNSNNKLPQTSIKSPFPFGSAKRGLCCSNLDHVPQFCVTKVKAQSPQLFFILPNSFLVPLDTESLAFNQSTWSKNTYAPILLTDIICFKKLIFGYPSKILH